MKQAVFVFLVLMLISVVAVCPLNAEDVGVPVPSERDPFAQTPEIRNYLGSDAAGSKGIDMDMIRVKGFMEVEKRKMALIDVKNAGTLAVFQGMQVELEKEGVPFFIVSSVTPAGVLVTFKDGEEIWYEYE